MSSQGRFANWALDDEDRPDVEIPSRVLQRTQAPIARPVYVPPPSQFAVTMTGIGRASGLVRGEPVARTNYIIRSESDGYADFLRTIPDLVAQGQVADYNPDRFDAMTAPGQPDGAAMSHWRPTSRYVNGSTDAQGAPIESALSTRYGANIGEIRSTAGMSSGRR